MQKSIAVMRLQLQLLRKDPWFLVVMFGMPLAVMPIFQRVVGMSLVSNGFPDANGAEQVVPGQTIVFGTFVAASVSFAVFREHGWKTWDRLRSSAITSRQLLAGFSVPWIGVHAIYQVLLFAVGFVLLDLRFNGGSPIASLLVIISFSCCMIAMILLATATLRTVNQVQVLTNLGAMVMGGIGGAFVPLEQLPDWARTIAPVTPTYWAMEGHRAVWLEHGGLTDVLLPCSVLLGAGLVFGALGAIRFRIDETKEFFA